MKKSLLLIGLLVLLSFCSRKRISNAAGLNLILEVEQAYVQREYPGIEGVHPQLKVHLTLVQNERVQINKVSLLNEELVLKKYKNTYTATFKNDGLLTFKGEVVPGIILYTLNQKQGEMPIKFEIKEDLYLP